MVFWPEPHVVKCEHIKRGETCNCPRPLDQVYADPTFRAEYSQELLREALMFLEQAAWNRSWSRLKKARALVQDVTGIKLRGRLTEMLK